MSEHCAVAPGNISVSMTQYSEIVITEGISIHSSAPGEN